jgi:hypothetical protein
VFAHVTLVVKESTKHQTPDGEPCRTVLLRVRAGGVF